VSLARGWLDGGRRRPELVVPALLGGVLLLYFLLPFVAFLGRVGSTPIVAGLSTPDARQAIRHSLLTAPVSTAIATVFGVPLAYVLARSSAGR
jgi:molybdate/tungstate transport system permease protein